MESNATSRSVFLKIVQHTFSLVVQDRSIIFTYIQKEFSGKRTHNVKKVPTALILCVFVCTQEIRNTKWRVVGGSILQVGALFLRSSRFMCSM